jgi:hypothetical protein
MTLYEKNMLSKYSIFNVDESANENDSSSEDPIVSDEPDEDEIEHEPFEFSLMTRFHFQDCYLI